MKLEIKHIYAYMPYGLQIKYPNSGKIYTVEVIDEADYINNEYPLSTVIYCIETQELQPLSFKLLLKPLSELLEIIPHNGLRYTDYLWYDIISSDCDSFNKDEFYELAELGKIEYLPIMVYNQLLAWKFDLFGLIDNGLAEVKE